MKYSIFKHSINIENNRVDTYGIILSQNEDEVFRIYDVSTDYNSLAEFVSELNKSHLDPFRFSDMLEEYMNNY